MISRLPKELCNHCQKSIRLGLPHFECFNCSKILHAKCFKPSLAEVINDNFYCMNCKQSIPRRYNPFKTMVDLDTHDSDPGLQQMCDILENCKSYSINDLNTSMKPNFKENLAMIFQNIDGNKTNFDSFNLELDRISDKFHVVGIAETNVGADESSVYNIEGYNCFYQDKHINKSKGSGVALYLTDSLNGVVNDELSWISNNLETLFITIQHNEPVHVGVIYRPPSGNASEALTELGRILELCPRRNLHLLGDYNIDLHNRKDKITEDFENLTLSLGLSPLISTSTHYKPGCKDSCIDNIFTNDIENTVCSGTIATCISHHHALFHILKSPLVSEEIPRQKYVQYYDYNNRNVDKFIDALNTELDNEPPEDFSQFFSVFNEELDKACKLDQPKRSKRTAKNNPWITPGLITAINKKHELHDLWTKAKKGKCLAPETQYLPDCLCSNCSLTRTRHQQFKCHRKSLTHLINCAKRKYTGEKINECKGDSKKTWQIIN